MVKYSSDKGGPGLGPETWLFLDSRVFGGIETHVLELAKGLMQHGHGLRVVLLSVYTPESPVVSKLRQANISHCYLDDLANAGAQFSLSSRVVQLRKAITQNQPAAVHAHGYKASIISKLATWRTNTRQITTYHAGETPQGRVRIYDFCDRLSAFMSRHSICVSPAIQKKLFTHSLYFNNFVNHHTPQEPNGNRYAFVGRLSHEKGPDRFIEVANQHSHRNFYLYGDGNMKSALAQNAGHNVRFEGFQPRMSQCWPEIEILIITSRFEGLPMAALEAMIRGIPVISTKVGAIASLIKHNQNGWLVDSPSEIPALLRQWETLSKAEKDQIRTQAIQTIQADYSDTAVIPKLVQLYQR